MTENVTAPSPPDNSVRLLIRAMRYLRPYWRRTVGVYIAMLLINGITIATPQLIRWMIDAGIYGGNQQLLTWAVLGLLAISTVKGVITFVQGGWTEVVSQHVAYDIRNQITEKLGALSFAFHDQTQTGQILSRTVQDVERIRFLTGRAVLRIVEGGVLLVGTAVVLIWMNWQLGLLVILSLPLLVHRAYVFGRAFRPLSLVLQDKLGELTAVIEQNLRGAQVVKGFAQENAEIDRFITANEAWFDLAKESARLQALNTPLLDFMANIGTVFILWVGGLLVADGNLTLGELVAFTTYLGQLVRPVRLIGRIVPILAIAASAGERIFGILDTPSDVKNSPDATPLPAIAGRVRFEEVSFGYHSDYPVLQGIDFEVAPGQVVALLGATGAGKSSLINLLARFYEPTNGRILVDGHDTRHVTLASLRQQIGLVLQDNWLFAASIRDNITFGRPDATDAEIIAAAQDAQAHSFISQLPDGYQTVVGERGTTLSGGQQQRVAIARALLTNPRILILDDATASVDTETERLIQQALDRLMNGRTTFVIAHRLSTIRRADLILVMEKGRIVAQGTHRELLQQSPLYAELYEQQLRPQEWAVVTDEGAVADR